MRGHSAELDITMAKEQFMKEQDIGTVLWISELSRSRFFFLSWYISHWIITEQELLTVYNIKGKTLHSLMRLTCDGIQTWGREHRRWCRRCRYGCQWRCCPERPLHPCTDTYSSLLETNTDLMRHNLRMEKIKKLSIDMWSLCSAFNILLISQS